MKQWLKTLIVVALPFAAHATMPTAKMAEACAQDNPGCMAYSIGAAERAWLATGKHTKCNAAADKKTVDALAKAVKGKSSIYASGKDETGAATVLRYLNEKKLQSCALSMRLSDLNTKCASKEANDQLLCQAYISGVLDMARVMDEVHQEHANPDKPYVEPFCESGKPKKQMSNDEVMQAVGAFSTAHAADAAKIPASGAVIDALVEKYPCKPSAASSTKTDSKK